MFQSQRRLATERNSPFGRERFGDGDLRCHKIRQDAERCQDLAKNPLGKISILFEYYFVFSFKISFFIHLNIPLDLPLENLNSEDQGLCRP